ncbi:MAG: glycosyltransferase family 2 protein [Verrucomicrobia bacterium]|nr:glycosyltransferase family 2 protein [Verrucomicrobiota bacterium]
MKLGVVVPVFNEVSQLAGTIERLRQLLLEQHFPHWQITIANNASTDGTHELAEDLCKQYGNVRLIHLDEKGRGRALKKVWLESEADILTYMDVDLSTDLSAYVPLVESLTSGQFDLAVGSRLLAASQTNRGFKRESISRGYNWLVKAFFHTRFSDAQCGFKAITRQAAQELLPLVEDTGWFFDTELLVLAEKLGYRICDLPVRWTDDPDSRVKIVPTAIDDVKGLIRVWRNFKQGKYPANREHLVELRNATSSSVARTGNPRPAVQGRS